MYAVLNGVRSGLLFRMLASLALLITSAHVYGNSDSIETVETTNVVLSFKAGSGDLIGVQWKHPKLDLISEPRLGENFRILLPLPDYEANYFNSRDQVVRKIERSLNRVVLHYGPLRNEREEVPIRVAYEIRDTGAQLEFSIQVDNGADRKIAEVFYAIVGGQQGIGARADTESMVPGIFPTAGYENLAPRLFSQFDYSQCCFGTNRYYAGYSYPSQMSMGWMSVYNQQENLGYYYANQDSENRITMLYSELRPYAKRTSSKDNWPSRAEVPTGEPIGLTMGWVNFPYAGKGLFRAGPIALQVHPGDWHAAAQLYRGWYDRHFKLDARPANWLRNEMAWQTITMSSPEDVVLFRFADLPKVAAVGKRYGVTTLHVYGWFTGGQDRGRPDHRPDPRLGTREEFRQALADIHAMGVRVLLGANLGVVDTSSEGFETRYSRYTVQGRWAPNLTLTQFGADTIGASLMKTPGRHMTPVSPAHLEFREEMIAQYLDLIREGVDGLQLDNVNARGLLDFNPTAPTSPDKSLTQGTIDTLQEFLARARQINPDFALSTVESYDRTLPYRDVDYFNIYSKDVTMPFRYTFPEWRPEVHAVEPSMIDLLSNALRYGAVWTVAPRAASASMDDPLTRPLSHYLSELIRIRKQYAELLFFGKFNDTDGAEVAGDKEDIRYSVFSPKNNDSERRAVVLVNFGDDDESAEVGIPGKQGQRVTISAPFQPDRVAILPVKLSLPPHHAAVVVSRP